MSAEEWISFQNYKEAQYEQRRSRINELCHQMKNPEYLKHLKEPRKDSIIYDNKHNLAYCQIAKVACSEPTAICNVESTHSLNHGS
jgi:hypothetical protein